MADWQGPLEKIDDYRWRIPQSYKAGMRVPGLIYSDEGMLQHIRDENALEQVANVAFLPGIVRHSLAMPDIHWGYGFAIGGVAAMRVDDGVVSPGGVGFDINCGVRLLRTNLTQEEIKPRLKELVATQSGRPGKGEPIANGITYYRSPLGAAAHHRILWRSGRRCQHLQRPVLDGRSYNTN